MKYVLITCVIFLACMVWYFIGKETGVHKNMSSTILGTIYITGISEEGMPSLYLELDNPTLIDGSKATAMFRVVKLNRDKN